MRNLSNSTKALLIGLAAVLVAVLLQSAFLLFGGISTVLIALICNAKAFVNKILERNGRSYYPSFWFITIVGYIIFVATSVVITGFIADWDLTFGAVVAIIIFNLFASILYAYLYFLPYLVANKREHLQTRAIYILNIFAGWTILAWIIALIWAYTVPKEHTVIHQDIMQSGADELKKYKDLLDQQIISEEEFDAKKKQILNLDRIINTTNTAINQESTNSVSSNMNSTVSQEDSIWVCRHCGTSNRKEYGSCKKCAKYRSS